MRGTIDPELFFSLMKKSGDFCHTIPVRYDDKEIGELKIDFKVSKQGKTDLTIKSYQGLIALELYNRTTRILDKDLKAVLRLNSMKKKGNIPIYKLIRFYLSPDEVQRLLLFQYPADEDILKIIEEEGPIALRNSDTLDRLDDWLMDKEIGPTMVKRLGESLLRYGDIPPEMPSKPGRREEDFTRIYGTEWIREMYDDIRSTLAEVRKRGIDNKEEARKSIEKEFDKHLRKKLRECWKNNPLTDKWKKMLSGWLSYKGLQMPNPIAEYMTRDNDLWNLFTPPSDTPHFLAKQVIAKMFGVSEEKIVSAIFRSSK